MNEYDFHRWLLLRKEFTNVLGKEYNDWYLSNNDIQNILVIAVKEITFFPTQNGIVPKHIPIPIIRYITNFEKYKVKYFIPRIKRLLKLSKNKLKASSKYINFLKYGKFMGLSLFYEKNKKSKITLENLRKKHGEEEGTKRYNNWYNARCNPLLTFQMKYGEEEGTKRYNNWCERNKGNHSLERLIFIYGEEDGIKRFNNIKEKFKKNGSLQYFIEKYGEIEGPKKYTEKLSKLHYGASLAGFIDKYGEIEGPKLFRESKDNCSLFAFIKRYGEEEGTKRYNEFVYKINKKPGSCISKASLLYFDYLSNYLIKNKLIDISDIFYGKNGKRGEYYLKYYKDNIPKAYFYDFTILSKKIIIEFNGVYYHAKKTLTIEEKNKWRNKTYKSAEDSIKHDEHKELIAKLNRV